MIEFDKGPLQPFARIFAACPDYGEFKRHFWYDWGPIFHRGRTNGSARVLCIASDPGATERIAARTLVGDAGQRVQGFLAKLGLTRSYLLLNAFSYALIPSQASQGDNVLAQPEQVAWRNRLLNLALTSETQAIVAFGVQARRAVDLWPGRGDTPVIEVPHPSSRDEGVLLERWRDAIVQLRALVTPDDDGDPGLPNYASSFRESDYAPVPARDLPFGVPSFLGNDAWGRARHPPRRGSVTRPRPDDRHTLVWVAPNPDAPEADDGG
jgi:uracil-DNA glycosylase